MSRLRDTETHPPTLPYCLSRRAVTGRVEGQRRRLYTLGQVGTYGSSTGQGKTRTYTHSCSCITRPLATLGTKFRSSDSETFTVSMQALFRLGPDIIFDRPAYPALVLVDRGCSFVFDTSIGG